MAETFQLRIVTPERIVYSEEVTSVTAPGVDGYFGVLAHHAAMLAEVGLGRLVAERPDGTREVMAVCGGFLEVRGNTTTVLADAAENQRDIDIARAQEAERRARARLEQHDAEIDVVRAETALHRALNRLSVGTYR